MLPISGSVSTSEKTAFGDTTTNTDNTSSGQHGQLINFAAGKGTSQTPAYTDSSGGVSSWVWLALGAAGVGVVVWFILRKKS
jgi:hypothetical protein